ncbi:hypothetical protein PHYPSEUDO_010935 [Phytophthora pseudosyringae]|uniref:BZIP domain-containing protein n=1 Tax=Phytophthora pseudosyringae TaxID=221518 RepID=A0A8T1VCH6_9STRA|nr:hypothetical protein PHYPSEUDO_010935 [Phytophthora pseudosyringae]
MSATAREDSYDDHFSRGSVTSQFDARRAQVAEETKFSVAAIGMSWHDRRMDITALCSAAAAEEQQPVVREGPVVVAGPSLPPLAPVRHTGGNSPKQHPPSTASASAGATGKVPSKKRSRRLSNSERGKLYRSRRKGYVQTLEEQVEHLKREVDQLNLYGQQHQQQQATAAWPLTRQPMGASFASVVNEYFSLFKYGVPVAEHGGVVDVPQDQLQLSSRQAGFLNGLMHPNMVFGSSYGVRELLDQWEKYSLYHAGLKYEVKNLQIMAVDPNPVVLAPATLYVRFTRRTIEEIFPHVLWNEALVQRLIGKQLEYPVGNAFYFGDDNKIHRYDTYVDFVAAFASVLGNVEDTMAMMESALIRQESMIGDLLEEQPRIKEEETQCLELVDSSDSYSSSESVEGPSAPFGPVGARIGMSLQGIL